MVVFVWDGRVYIYDVINVVGGIGFICFVIVMNNNFYFFFDCDFN